MARTVSVMLSPPFSAALPVPVSVFVFGVSWSPAQTGIGILASLPSWNIQILQPYTSARFMIAPLQLQTIQRMSGLEECRNDKARVCGIAWWQHAIYM